MIQGVVDEAGVPIISLAVADREWEAIVDTGFSGDLELPDSLRNDVDAEFWTVGHSLLAAGQVVEEDLYKVSIPFDGEPMRAIASFVPGDQSLVGTHLLRRPNLEINFPKERVVLERVES